MDFDPSTAKPTELVQGFDPSTAKLVEGFDPSSAVEAKQATSQDEFTSFAKQHLLDVSKAAQQPSDKPKLKIDSKLAPTKDFMESGLSSTVGAGVDVLSGTIGLPVSLAVGAHILTNGGSIEDAHRAMETTRDWSSVRHIIKEYGMKLGKTEAEMDKQLYSPNFIDKLFETLQEKAIEPVTKWAGYGKNEEGMMGVGKMMLEDSLMTLFGAGAAKLGKTHRGTKTTTPKEDIQTIIRNQTEQKAANGDTWDTSLESRKQGELFPAGQQEMQFGEQFKKPGELVTDFDPTTAKEVAPIETGQMELPLETPKGQTPDMFAPTQVSQDLNSGQAKNPFLDETTLRDNLVTQYDPGMEQMVAETLKDVGTATPTGLEQAGLPFRLTGQLKGQGGFISIAAISEIASRIRKFLDTTKKVREEIPLTETQINFRNYQAKEQIKIAYENMQKKLNELESLKPNKVKEINDIYDEIINGLPQLYKNIEKEVKTKLDQELVDYVEKGIDPYNNPKKKKGKISPYTMARYYEVKPLRSLDDVESVRLDSEEIARAKKFIEETEEKNTKYLRTFGALSPEEGQWIPRIWSSSSQSGKNKIDQMVSPFSSLKDLVADNYSLFSKPESDPGVFGWGNMHLTTKNQVPNVVNSPSITYFVGGVREAYSTHHRLANIIASAMEQFDRLAGPKQNGDKILAVLTEIQKNKYQEYGKAQGLKEMSDEALIKLGLKEEDIPAFRVARKINEAAGQILQATRKELTGTDVPMPVFSYHPKSYGIGDKALVVLDKKTGQVVRAHRYQDYKEMFEDRETILNELTKADALKDFEVVHRADIKSWENPFTNINSSSIPDVIQKILSGIEEKIETRKRTFELERANQDIKGMVQYLKDGVTPDPHLRDVWNAYLKNVLNFKKNTDIFKLQRELVDNASFYGDKPKIHNYIQDMLQNELGSDIAWKPMRTLERALLEGLNAVEKARLKNRGQLISPDDFVISNNSVRGNVSFAAGTASAATLLFDVPNAAVNAIQMPMTGVVGLPLDIMGRLRANPKQLIEWTLGANGEFAKALHELVYTKATGKPTRASLILDKYAKDGHVRAHMFDEISEISPQHSEPNGLINSAKRVVGKTAEVGRKWTNDLFIEQPTNATALLYYDILVNQIAREHLEKNGATPKQLKELPVVLAKSWTGDYAKWTKPMYLEKLGLPGTTAGNFNRWSHNQWGRFVEVVRDANLGDGTSLFNGLVAAMTFGYVYANLAGAKNAPLMATWDTLRNAYNHFKENEEDTIPDLNYYAKEWGIPEAVFPQNSILDKTGLDLSSSQRYADPANLNTITPKFWYSLLASTKDAAHILTGPWGEKDLGFQRKQIMKDIVGLPRYAQGLIKDKIATFPNSEGTNSVVNRFDKFAYSQQQDEKIANIMGFKTPRQRKEMESQYHQKIFKTKQDNEAKRTKDALLQQMTDYFGHDGESFSTEAGIMKNMLSYQKIHPEYDTKDLLKDVQTRVKNMTEKMNIEGELTPTDKKLMERGGSPKAVLRLQGKLERFKKRLEKQGLYSPDE